MINNLNKVRFYRCTQLARKSQRDNFYQNLSMALGTHLHKALAVKHSQLWPTRHHEQEQICLFSYKGYIKSLLGGTPDMFWTEADTLYVVDYKTKKDTSKTKTQSAHFRQRTDSPRGLAGARNAGGKIRRLRRRLERNQL